MGKRDTRYAFMNPIALARARGSSTSSGPTIRDYLNRSRPSWEEVKKVLQQRKEGCSTLAAWENFQDDLNKKYNNDLKSRRKMLLKKKSQDKLIKVKEKVSRLLPSSSSSLNSSISNPYSKASDEHQVNKKRQKSECDLKKEKKEKKMNELKKNRKNDHKKHKNKVKKHQK